MSLGIIPCAGEGSRWGGALKELLPIGTERWLIDNTIEAFENADVDKICIVSSEAKIHSHVQHFKKDKYKDLDIFFVIQRERRDIWGAILAALPFYSNINFFAMPDTVYPTTCFYNNASLCGLTSILFGVFNTTNGDRFGVLNHDSIDNKNPKYAGRPKRAWGNFVFGELIASVWLDEDQYGKKFESYTDALNYAIKYYSLNTYELDYYYDFENWKAYLEWMQKQQL